VTTTHTMAEQTPAAAQDLIIIARGVEKTYSTDSVKVHALRGIDLDVRRGEMVAIMGPSGCGKTTLLNCLSGLDTIDRGQVLIEGQDLSKLSDARRTEFRARRMGFVFQLYNLLPVLTAVENVELPLLVSGVSASEARRRAMEALELVHLTAWANHRPAQLSGGQRQRVTIARALVNNPAIVWGDEPTGDLDSQNAHEILNLMVDLNQRLGVTFVLVTHDANMARRTHRIIGMADGRITSEERIVTPA
jgi:ABC-type lipoprotein export system ATPase subunit